MTESDENPADFSANPYAPPAIEPDTTLQVLEPGENAEAHYLRIFVGSNADYYLPRWSHSEESTGFNWSAFFLGDLWASYRAMYRIHFMGYGLSLAALILIPEIYRGLVYMPVPPIVFFLLFLAAKSFIFGIFGNRWYLNHSRRHLAEVCSMGLDENQISKQLTIRGAVNALTAFGLTFLEIFFTMFAVSAWFSITRPYVQSF